MAAEEPADRTRTRAPADGMTTRVVPGEAPAPRVLMLVINPMRADARVAREAASLAAAGYEVLVVATADAGLPAVEERDGYTISRRPYRRTVKDAILQRRARRSAELADVARALDAVESHVPRSAWRRTRVVAWLHNRRLALRASRARLEHVLTGAFLRLVRSRLLVVEYWQSIASTLPATVARCDVVHAHDLGTLAAAARVARDWSRRHPGEPRPRVVYDSHEYYLEQNTTWTRFEKLLWALHERRWIRRADAVITVSDGIADALRRRYLLRRRPEVVINSPGRLERRPTARDVRRDAGVAGDTPLAVYIGGVKPGRGVDRLVPAMERSCGWHLALVGAGDSEYVGELMRAAERAGVRDRLHVLPPMPSDELVSYIATADVGLHPMEPVCLNHELALPNKLFTYVYAGLPVAVSRLAEMAAFVRSYGVGTLFDPYDPEEIGHAVEAAIRRRSELRASRSRLAEIERAYGWREQQRRLLATYSRLGVPPVEGGSAPAVLLDVRSRALAYTSSSTSAWRSHA